MMTLPNHVLLGAIAGLTIFLGLPVARWRAISSRAGGLLALTAAGVVLFLVIEVGFQAMQRVEAAVLGGGGALAQGMILAVGFTLGLVGLARLEDRRRRKRAAGASALEVATMVAVGIGVHNFAEGLAIGQSFAGGSAQLGMVLVVGFGLHNATEGFGIAGALAGRSVSWPRLVTLGLIGGAPTMLGALVGGLWVSPSLELLFLALATGSLVYVTRELFRVEFAELAATGGMLAVTAGLLLGFGTELVVDVGMSRGSTSAAAASSSVRYEGMEADPAEVSLVRGETLEIRNDADEVLVFEGNGLYPGEVAVSPGASVSVATTGSPGTYRLVDERGLSGSATVVLEAGSETDPLLGRKNAAGALTVLEGHVRAASALHRRGLSDASPDAQADLARAGAHAGHPWNELLRGDEPDALALQGLLRETGLFEDLDRALAAFVARAGDAAVSVEDVDEAYDTVLATVERARQAVAGGEYRRPSFRSDVVVFVLETAAAEYATAAEGGNITAAEAGSPGRDDYIEYQDAGAFVAAARELVEPLRPGMTPDARQAFDSLDRIIFRTLDPPAPEAPLHPDVVRAVVRSVLGGLPRER